MPVDAEDAMLSIQNEPTRSGCCCVAVESIPKCTRCGPSWFICCMKVTRSDWTQFAILRANSNVSGQGSPGVSWTPGDPCPPIVYYTGEVYAFSTNLCGGGRSWWGNHGFDSSGSGEPHSSGNSTSGGLPIDGYPQEATCRKPEISFRWVISEDCKTLSVAFEYKHVFRHEGYYYVAEISGQAEAAWTQDRTLDFPYTITTDDPEYRALYNAGHPDFTGPIPQVTFTISLCGEGEDETNLPDVVDNDVKLFGHYVWYCNDTFPATVFDGMDVVGEAPVYGRGRGNDICGSAWVCSGEGTFGGDRLYEIYWELLPDLATIRIVVVAYFDDPGGLGLPPSYDLIGSIDVPYNAGSWPSDGPWEITGFVGGPASAPACSSPWNGTFVIQSVTSCTIPDCPSPDCFPSCIASTIGCDGVTATHANLFIDIGLNGADGFETMGWDELNNEYNAGPILTADETMGSYFESVSFRLRCNGGQPELRVLRRVWHSYDDYDVTFTEFNGPTTIVCVGGEVTITDGGYTIISNNNGLP